MPSAVEYLLTTRGTSRALGAHVISIAFSGAGQAAYALADGTLHLLAARDADWHSVELSNGAVLDLTRDCSSADFIAGDDDGGFVRINPDGDVQDIARFTGKWVEHVASFPHQREGLIACSVGRQLHLYDAAGALLKTLDHPSTVTGLAFDSKGKRLAASHYNGATLWFTGSKSDNPRRLEWKGSHTGVAMHPSGDAVVTAMQENALHGWRLADGQHMRMSGYPAKSESLSFSRSGKWLASSGADAVVLWPFFGGGPMGKAPMELAGGRDVLCTRVACHPLYDACAAAFADGLLVMIDLNGKQLLAVAPAEHGMVTALAWSADGTRLAFGTEQGHAALVDFA